MWTASSGPSLHPKVLGSASLPQHPPTAGYLHVNAPQLSTVLVTEPVSVPLILQSWPQSSLKAEDRMNLLFLPPKTEKWHDLRSGRWVLLAGDMNARLLKIKAHCWGGVWSFFFFFPSGLLSLSKFTFISFFPQMNLLTEGCTGWSEMRNNSSLTPNLRIILPSYTVPQWDNQKSYGFFFEAMLIIEKMCREKWWGSLGAKKTYCARNSKLIWGICLEQGKTRWPGENGRRGEIKMDWGYCWKNAIERGSPASGT